MLLARSSLIDSCSPWRLMKLPFFVFCDSTEKSETHFKVVVVSHEFESIPALIGRHRLIHAAVADLLTTGGGSIHAFSIVAKTPAQWEQMTQSQGLENDSQVVIEPSPDCRGGDGSLPKRRQY
jgi:stress-induced morphogen